MGRFWAIAATVCATAVLGCGKTARLGSGADDAWSSAGEGGASAGGPAGVSGSSGARPAGGTSSGGFGNTSSGGKSGGSAGGETACDPTLPADAPLRRLTRFEYENSLRALFGEQSWATNALPVDPYEDATAPSPALVDAQYQLARDLAFGATETETATQEFIGCDATVEGAEECRDRFIDDFVGRAFRRPLTTAELEQFTSTFDGAATGGEFSLGVRAVIQVALQSPEFLYLPEFGVAARDRGDGWARPAPYEMASRLSYLLWGAPPDAKLLDAARNDALRSSDEVEAQARRMLDDPLATRAIGNFYIRLLELDGATFPAAGLAPYPTFTAEVAAQLLGETEAFAADVTLVSEGDLRTLLTAPYTFVNEPLAAFYELPGVSGSEFRRAELDPERRGGILTQGSFLAATALGPLTNPSERGLRVLKAFFCQAIPRHPVDSASPEPLPGTTTRERFDIHATEPSCRGCHGLVDPLGFAFEHYDAAGLYRDTENGVAIDATGSFDMTDVGDFDGALELVDRLAQSADVRRCFVQNWYSRALGRRVTDADACYVSALDRDFVAEATNLRELLIALVRNDAFLYRPEVAP